MSNINFKNTNFSGSVICKKAWGIKIILSLFLFSSVEAFAHEKILTCTSGSSFETFNVTLDYGSFDPASDLFTPMQAYLRDNYAVMSRMLCAGYKLENLSCVGYFFNSSSVISEVTLKEENGVYFANHRPLKDDLSFSLYNSSPWPCELKEDMD